MNETLRLGEFAGVRIGVNWSVLVIFVLVLLGIGFGYLPVEYPDRAAATYLLAGAITAVAFFLSLLAHELAHALVARGEGVDVEGITLWMFGGVAKLEGEAMDPRGDLRISAVGPLVSVVLGMVFYGITWLGVALGAEGVAIGVLNWLGFINIALAVFNLVPAAPLDGGRILRALLWKRRGDRFSASITASRAGKAFGFGLVALGLVTIIAIPQIPLFNGLWIALLGWILATAAAAEEQHARIQRSLGDLRVADVMSVDPMTVPRGLAVQDVLEDYVLRSRYSAFPIVDGQGRPTGLVTLNHLKRVDREDRVHVAVEEVACSREEMTIAAPDTPLAELLTRMQGCAEGRVVVIEDDRIVGIVSATDMTRTLQLADLRSDSDRQHI